MSHLLSISDDAPTDDEASIPAASAEAAAASLQEAKGVAMLGRASVEAAASALRAGSIVLLTQ
eukprot:3355634-Rhodomonas_salina.1